MYKVDLLVTALKLFWEWEKITSPECIVDFCLIFSFARHSWKWMNEIFTMFTNNVDLRGKKITKRAWKLYQSDTSLIDVKLQFITCCYLYQLSNHIVFQSDEASVSVSLFLIKLRSIVYNSLPSTALSFAFNYLEKDAQIVIIFIDEMFTKVKNFLSISRTAEFSLLNVRDDEASSSTRVESYGSFMPYLGFIRNTFLLPHYQVISNWSEW